MALLLTVALIGATLLALPEKSTSLQSNPDAEKGLPEKE